MSIEGKDLLAHTDRDLGNPHRIVAKNLGLTGALGSTQWVARDSV
jgi:hypothetical protein